MIWQREVALPLRSDWLTAGKAVHERLIKKRERETEHFHKTQGGGASSPLSLQPRFTVACKITSSFASPWKKQSVDVFCQPPGEKAPVF